MSKKTENSNDLAIFPVTGWAIGYIPMMDAVFIQLSFLSSPLQRLDEADEGRRYVFQRQQLEILQAEISKALAKLENAVFEPPAGPIQ